MDWTNLRKYFSKNLALIQSGFTPIVFMGDSITEFWSNYNNSFFKENGFVNRGISGQTTSQMLLRFGQDVIQLQPSKVVILAGINDIAENTGPISIENIMGNIISMVELAKANHIEVVLCSVLPANKFDWNHKIQPADKVIELNKLIQKFAEENNINYVDYFTKMVDDNKGLKKIYGNDGVHPNKEGYKIMEQLLLKAIL